MAKTRHREYVDAIKSKKSDIKVDKDYSKFLINRTFCREEKNIHHLNAVNFKPLRTFDYDTKEQRLFEKQMHFDYLVNSIEGYD